MTRPQPRRNPPRRPVAGSRPASSSPRRLAGHGTVRPEEPALAEESFVSEEAPVVVDEPTPTDEAGPVTGPLARRRTTKVLGAVLTVLLVVGIGEVVYLVAGGPDDPPPAPEFDPAATYEVPEQPITIPLQEWRAANEAAAEAVEQILTVSWQDYDQHVEDVADLMTDEFADEYAATAEDTRDRFVESKAEYEFSVVGRSVMSARPDEVTSLLFLNQLVRKGEGEDQSAPEVFQVRVVVTTVRQDGRWVVSSLDAQ